GFSNGRQDSAGAKGRPLPPVSPAPPAGYHRGATPSTQPHPSVNVRHAGGSVAPPSSQHSGSNGHSRPSETTGMPAPAHVAPNFAHGGPNPAAGRAPAPGASAPVPPAGGD